MILGFKDQFVPFVLDGTKTHTIRAGERWKVGMRADLFARPQQKDMRLLFRAQVVRVEEIAIRIPTPLERQCRPSQASDILHVAIEGSVLDWRETESFFQRDGFRDIDECPCRQALRFWRDRLPFHGQIIHWDYEQRYMEKPGAPKQRYCTSMMCSHYGEPINGRHSCAP